MAEKKEPIEAPKIDKKKIEIQQVLTNILNQWVKEEIGNRVTSNNAWALRAKIDQYLNQLEIEQ